MATELKPCPFCGKEPFTFKNSYFCDPVYVGLWTVECNGCHATTFEYDFMEEAIEAWNRRLEDSK